MFKDYQTLFPLHGSLILFVVIHFVIIFRMADQDLMSLIICASKSPDTLTVYIKIFSEYLRTCHERNETVFPLKLSSAVLFLSPDIMAKKMYRVESWWAACQFFAKISNYQINDLWQTYMAGIKSLCIDYHKVRDEHI